MLEIRDLSQPWKTYENSFDMRFAIRKGDPSVLADRVYARRGRKAAGAQSGIAINLRDQRNWYLNWNNKIGL